MAAKTAYLASKPRYEILDGLRGVASLIVVLFGFFKRRLVRLHPMVVMGTVIGLCFYYLSQGDGFQVSLFSPLL